MDLHRYMSFSNILTFSLPLFFILLSWVSSTTTTSTPPSPPPSSVIAAAETLRTRGYSLFSSALISTFSGSSPNFSATILAAPDFLFAFSPNPTRRALPSPSTTLLLYHTLQPPSLRWFNLTSLPDGNELRTLHNNYCLFLIKNAKGDISISSSKKANGDISISAVNIRQPDLYVDENLAVHGVDGVLDPTAAHECSSISISDLTVEIQWAHRSFLDHAIRKLRRRGFHVAATALALRRTDLLTLPAVTVFVPSDKTLFSKPDGFRYDSRHHVVPKRLRFNYLVTLSDGAEYETLAPNKTVFIQSNNDAVSINGIRVDGAELYHNRWIVLYSLPMTLDDAAAGEFPGSGNWVPSSLTESQFPGRMPNYAGSEQISNGVPTALPDYTREFIGPPSPAPESHFPGEIENGVPRIPPVSGQEHVEDVISELIKLPPSQAMSDTTDNHCDVVSGISVGVENLLFCPVNDPLDMQENEEIHNTPDVAPYQPVDGVAHYQASEKLSESEPSNSGSNDTDERETDEGEGYDKSGKGDPDPTNIAGDLFYYT